MTTGTSIEALRQPMVPQVPAAALPISAGEMAASAIASQARATVLARYEMALRQPRNLDQVRQELLRECKRPSFANNKSAYYRKPIGDGVEGLGIRFVEVALRCMKNVLIETQLVYEDESKEVHRVTVTDLEANTTYPQDVKVSKTVERRKPNEDGSFISVRKNSYGKDVYTVQATDDDLLNKRAALISKAIRTLGLRVIPGWMQDEAEDIIKEVRRDEAARDPDEAKRKIIDAFAELNVAVVQLEEYLGHPIGTCQPQEIVDLRGFYGAIKDGETTWASIMEHRRQQDPAPPKDAKPAATAESLRRPPAGKPETRPETKQPPTPAPKPAPAPTAAPESMFTVVDALAMVARGEFDEARDVARALSEENRKKVEAAISARGGNKPTEDAEPATTQAPSGGDVDLVDVLKAINDASDVDTLNSAGVLIDELGASDADVARSKWMKRKAELDGGSAPAGETRRRRGSIE